MSEIKLTMRQVILAIDLGEKAIKDPIVRERAERIKNIPSSGRFGQQGAWLGVLSHFVDRKKHPIHHTFVFCYAAGYIEDYFKKELDFPI